jgi:hypothetical protein
MTDSKITINYPGVYIEETRINVKVISGVTTSEPIPSGVIVSRPAPTPSELIADGYEVVETSFQPGGLALLLGKGRDLVLFRMVDVREGGGGVEGHLAVIFSAKVP